MSLGLALPRRAVLLLVALLALFSVLAAAAPDAGATTADVVENDIATPGDAAAAEVAAAAVAVADNLDDEDGHAEAAVVTGDADNEEDDAVAGADDDAIAAVDADNEDAAAGVAEVVNRMVSLDDGNFESLTQAYTGSTTGDWFVIFYADWCPYCLNVMPTLEELSHNHFGEVNFGRLDISASPDTKARFNVTSVPALIHLHKGQYYRFMGQRNVASISHFITGGFEEFEGTPVPPPLPLSVRLHRVYQTFVSDLKASLDQHRAVTVSFLMLGVLAGMAAGVAASQSLAPPPTCPSVDACRLRIAAATASASRNKPRATATPAGPKQD
ncbi:hypothetical protein H696_00846 [Fonticula alba]|uniref:Thioredoxin domain-containing protein n=1 Tax=Fonticula alba TaxID=691883 RepID=A0A058ZFY4_FONAL|nr:hypothetical protein H696_00846 [Fonticula alba]KCV73305.1 hypothetical protein H696_00846 [Fonticula alba]|eukprot:XP_009493006.1 hypothetical protein H696_00846 [Fonticula alba]